MTELSETLTHGLLVVLVKQPLTSVVVVGRSTCCKLSIVKIFINLTYILNSIPKGTPDGLRAELFVMISNYEEDRVVQDLAGTCNDAASYCGVRDRLYPDLKAMGYPFDRLPRPGADTLGAFLTPNMRVQDCAIVFNDRVTPARN